jgi:hypothetical protein
VRMSIVVNVLSLIFASIYHSRIVALQIFRLRERLARPAPTVV